MTTTDMNGIEPAAAMSKGLTFTMAAAAGIAVANIYYNQPMLALIEGDLSGRWTVFVPTITQLGYAAGLLLLVPVGDLVERRRLIVLQFGALAVVLALAAVAPTGAMLLAASLLIGVAATVTQQIVPFAANLSSAERRGATVGTVVSGVLAGILLSRTLAGFVAENTGWREMFWLGVPLAAAAGLVMWWRLPRSHSTTAISYLAAIASIGHLWREFRDLRIAAWSQASLFASFSVFWTVLAFRLQEPTFSLGADVAGLFGIIGAVGILIAPIAGRLADTRGPRLAIVLGAVGTLLSWGVFGFWTSIAGLVVGVILLDLSVHASLVSNQHIVFSLRADARARLNTILMGAMFIGGAVGSALSTLAWDHGGWPATSVLGAAFALSALAAQAVSHRR